MVHIDYSTAVYLKLEHFEHDTAVYTCILHATAVYHGSTLEYVYSCVHGRTKFSSSTRVLVHTLRHAGLCGCAPVAAKLQAFNRTVVFYRGDITK